MIESYRFPLSAGPTLKIGWNSVLVSPRSRKEVVYLAADPRDDLWTSGLSIRRYSFESSSFEIAFDIETLTIAPVSEARRWAVAFDSEETFDVCASEEEGIRRMPGLPRDEFPYIITAAPDDTVWVRTIAKAVFMLQPNREGWNEVSLAAAERRRT